MKSRTSILLLAIFTVLLPAVHGQNSGAELPSAPSASQPSAPAPRPAPAAQRPSAPPAQPAAQPSADPQTVASPANPAAEPSANAGQQSEPQKNAPAAAPSTPQTAAPAGTSPSEDDAVSTIRKTVNEVNVVFTVTDKHGRYVKDLKKKDFRIIDDSKPAEEIRSFNSEADLPLQVGLLIDASNSVRDRFKFEQEAAIEFLNQTIRRKYDSAMVIGFDVTPEVTQDFTDNTEALSIGVRALRPGGGTAMYDAMYFACRDKLLKATQSGPVRRAIILLSDGEDNQSHVTREEAIEMAQRAEVVVYTISTNLTGGSRHGDKVLERIAEASGGRAYVPFQLSDVANAFAAIQEELRSQYAISYKPADFKADGHYRTIEILAQEKSLHVRSRHGYYAPSQ